MHNQLAEEVQSGTAKRDLAVVIPVYNEEGCVADVVADWRDQLSGMQVDFRIIVLNDGSRDGTRARLELFGADDRIKCIHKENSGHGPTILMGYRMALAEADWVFQVDGDNEMPCHHFPELWSLRHRHDALFGFRKGRAQNSGRRLISAVSRLVVRLLFAAGVTDVNTPYRLMRAEALAPMVQRIKDDTFAPNIIISGLFALSGASIHNHPVSHEGRKTGTVSIVRWRLWKAAARAFLQTISHRCQMSGRSIGRK